MYNFILYNFIVECLYCIGPLFCIAALIVSCLCDTIVRTTHVGSIKQKVLSNEGPYNLIHQSHREHGGYCRDIRDWHT